MTIGSWATKVGRRHRARPDQSGDYMKREESVRLATIVISRIRLALVAKSLASARPVISCGWDRLSD